MYKGGFIVTKENNVVVDENKFPEDHYGKITDKELQRLRNRIGKEIPIDEPFIRSVNEDNIRRVARGIGDNNPLYIDREHAKKSRYGKLVAPLALYYGVAWGSWDMRKGQGLPGGTWVTLRR